MTWQKIDEMPCVLDAIRHCEKEIETLTGVSVILKIEAIEINSNEGKLRTQEVVSKYFNITWQQIQGKDRSEVRVAARHIYMYIAYTMLGLTLREIGQDCGNRDHTSVIHAVKKIKGYYQVGDVLVDHIEAIKKLLPIKLTNET